MKRLGIILFTLFFIITVSAVEITQLDPNTQIIVNDNNPDAISNIDLQVMQKLAAIENKVDNLPTKGEISQAINFLNENTQVQIRDRTDFLILALSMVFMFVLGLGVGIYFLLRARGRL